MSFRTYFSPKIAIAFLTSVFFFTACNKSDTGINEEENEIISTIPGDSRITTMATNAAPSPRSGPDQTITLPLDSVIFDAVNSYDPDGTITGYLWTKEIGPFATISSPTSMRTVVKSLTVGSYRFGLTVTDNSGATGSDTVHVTVLANPSGNQNPIVTTGPPKTIVLPTNFINLGATASDPDGSIVSYLWTKVSGQGGSVVFATSNIGRAIGLSVGSYVFNVKVTDNQGAVANSSVNVTVRVASPPNQSPVVTTGATQTVTLPVSTATISGSATDADGTIASYLWTKVSGPAGGNITSSGNASTTVTGLTAGSYVFNLRATDNLGATGNKTINVNVNAASPPPNQSPIITIVGNIIITLPISLVTLSGSATDPDGTIVSYLWTRVSGIGGLITNPNAASTTVTALLAGTYVFNLRATDNAGATSNRTVSVTVNPLLPPPPGYGTLVYSTGYNALSDIINGSNQHGNGGLSTSIFKTGPGSFKSVPANVSGGNRSEVQYSASLTANEGVIEYDVMYETLFQNNGHSLQFHPNTSGASASPGLWHEGGKFTLANWYNGDNAKYPSGMSIATNQWYHIVLEYKFGSSGYLHFYVDGVLKINANNIQVGDGSGQYLKVGVNMWTDQSSVVYYDNLKIWRR